MCGSTRALPRDKVNASCKLATVKSTKANVSSVSPLSEQKANARNVDTLGVADLHFKLCWLTKLSRNAHHQVSTTVSLEITSFLHLDTFLFWTFQFSCCQLCSNLKPWILWCTTLHWKAKWTYNLSLKPLRYEWDSVVLVCVLRLEFHGVYVVKVDCHWRRCPYKKRRAMWSCENQTVGVRSRVQMPLKTSLLLICEKSIAGVISHRMPWELALLMIPTS